MNLHSLLACLVFVRVAGALRAYGAECTVGDALDARRIADDFGSPGALHRLVLLGPGTAAHHALSALLLDRLTEGGKPSYGAGSRIVIQGRGGRLGRPWLANLRLAHILHEWLKDASLSRRVQCLAALGVACAIHAACDPALRRGDCVAPSGAAERSDGHSPRCSRTTPPAPSWPPVAGSPSAGLVPLALPDLTEIELSAPANNAA